MDIRPRTLGEICDDAWRLALADAPFLLLFNALSWVPAFTVLLLLLAQPVPAGADSNILPAVAALLLPLTGWSSGACQELFRQRLASPQQGKEQMSPVLHAVLAALRHSLEHVAARAVLLSATLPGPCLFLLSFLPDTAPIGRFMGFWFGSLWTFLLSVPLWGFCTSAHILLSEGAFRSGTLLSELRREIAAAAGKSIILVFSRYPLLLLLALQLHLLTKILLWATDNLGGFDTSLFDVQLTLWENPVYTLALFLLSWLLLTPFFEASYFLLHTDIRTRQEGLDLQYRVQRAFNKRFSGPSKYSNGVNCSLTAVVLILLLGGGAGQAAEGRREKIRAVRQEVETIRAEIQQAKPYPGSRPWQARLRHLQAQLARGSGGPQRLRWFEHAIDDLTDRKKEDALRILEELQQRLLLLEEAAPSSPPAGSAEDKPSPEQIKSLLRNREGRSAERRRPQQSVEENRLEIRREQSRGKEPPGKAPQAGNGPGVPRSVPAISVESLSFLGWWLLGGFALAVVGVSVLLYLTSPRSPRPKKNPSAASAVGPSAENDIPRIREQSPTTLRRQADTLAGDGHCRDAVRLVYLAVLVLLHHKRLIRFEPTRTDGEYVRQVYLSEQAPPELGATFERLTHLFETAWYGERLCEADDYHLCRTLADTIQQLAGGA